MAKVNCTKCGKEFNKPSTRIFKNNYCSRDCMRTSKEVPCRRCGIKFKIKKHAILPQGNYCSLKCCDKDKEALLKGEGNPFYGKSHSEETRKRMSESRTLNIPTEEHPRFCRVFFNCDYCGKTSNQNPYEFNKSSNHYCSTQCKADYQSDYLVGENNPNWNGILTKEDRMSRRLLPGYSEFTQYVRLRDKFTCRKCSEPNSSVVHHLNSYHWDTENRVNPDNCVTLCAECHKEFHTRYGYRDNTRQQFEDYLIS